MTMAENNYIANINHEFDEWYLYHVMHMHNEALFIDKGNRFSTEVNESIRQLRNCYVIGRKS